MNISIFNLFGVKKHRPDAEEQEKLKRQQTAQEWMPIADIDNGITIRKDGYITAALRITPVNIELLSESEQRRKVNLWAEQLNSEKEFQIHAIGRSVDLDNYINWLERKLDDEANAQRKKGLKEMIKNAADYARRGEAIERCFYILINQKNEGRKSIDELLSKADAMVGKLGRAEIKAEVCSSDEIYELYYLFAFPIQAVFEKIIIEEDLPALYCVTN